MPPVRICGGGDQRCSFLLRLKLIPHKKVEQPKVKLQGRSRKHAYDDEATLARRKFVPEIY